jgi:predicted MFS family arabinose efflux permease
VTDTDENAPLKVFAVLRATPRPVRYLLGGVLINQLGTFVQTFLILYLVHEGMSPRRAGVCLAAYGAGAVVGALLGGELSQRMGPRNTIMFAMTCSALLVSLVPWLGRPDRFPELLVLVVVTGAVTQAYRPAAATMVSALMPDEHRVMAFSMIRIAMNIGAALSPLLAAAFIRFDWDLLFWFDGVTALAYALMALILLPADRPVADHDDHDGDGDDPAAGRGGYRIMLHDGRFLIYLASMLLSSIIYVQFTSALPLTLTAGGQSPELYSFVLTASSTILVLFELKVTTYVRRWPVTVAAGSGTALFVLGLAGYGLSSTSVVAILACTAVSVTGVMMSGPTMFAHSSKAPAAVRGRYIGASQAMFGLGAATGPALGVLAWARWGNGVWAICGLAGVVATVCAVVGVSTPRSATTDDDATSTIGEPIPTAEAQP